MMVNTPAAESAGRRGIGLLIENLRKEQFQVGTSEAIDAAQLLVILSERETEPMEPAQLCARLRPIFCKSEEQQKNFDRIFLDWYEAPPPKKSSDKQVLQVETSGQVKAKAPRTKWYVAIAVVVVVIAASAPLWWPRPKLNQAASKTPTVTSTASPAATSTSATITPETTAASESLPAYGYFPVLRYNVELRPGWAWLLVSLPLAALLGFSVPALIIARTRAQRRGDPMYLDRGPLEEDARRIVPPLRPDITDRMARHLRVRPDDDARPTRRPLLDLRGTIEDTLRNRGIPTPRYRHTQTHPSYLLLVDVANQKDPRGRMFYQWAERLQRERLEVEIAMVRLNNEKQPQFAHPIRGDVPSDERAWLPLARLPRPPFGQRMLLISTGELLAETDGTWRSGAVAARLHRWPERAVFTPIEPRDWEAREDSIERSEHTADAGFIVLPLDENALSAWTDLLNTGHLSNIVLSEPQRYPALLRRGRAGDFVITDASPDPARVEKLVSQLRVYLGEEGFTWLAALAIPPLIRWELTLLLGRDLLSVFADRRKDVDALLARNYQRMARLPWLRLESMPDWLRLRLIAELPQSLQGTVRKVVDNLLGGLSPSPGIDGIALDFERPPVVGAPPAGTLSSDSDPLYLGYMSGLTPQQLAIRAPAKWGKWLGGVHLPRERGLRGWFARSSDQTRAWWSRRMFRDGMPFSTLRPRSYVWASLLLLLAAGALAFVALTPVDRWLDPVSDRLFDEQTHSIAFEHAGQVTSAAFSPDGTSVVTASEDGTARVWDVTSGAPITPPLRHAGPIHYVEFNTNGTRVVTASADGTARVWDPRSGVAITPPLRHEGAVRYAAFSADGRRVVTASDDDTARVWDSQSGAQVGRSLQHSNPVAYAEFSPNGREIITATEDKRLRVWDEVRGNFTWSRFPNRRLLSNPAFSPDGNSVMGTGGPYNLASIMDVQDGAPFFPFSLNAIKSAQFSPDGHRLMTVSDDNTVQVWQMESGKPVGVPMRLAGVITDAEFSRDGRMIVTASRDKTVRVWNAQSGQPIGNPLRHDDIVTLAKFSPDGRRIITAGGDKTARMWVTGDSHPVGAPMRHKDLLMNAAFSPDGRRVVTGSWDTTARVWDSRTGAPVTPPLKHAGKVWSAAFSPDGRRVVTASGDQTARIWDSATGQPVTVPLRHAGIVFYATFSPDGSRVLTACHDGTARIWDARNGLPVGTPLRHQGDVTYALFSPDGTRVVTASSDGTARIWDAPSGKSVGRPLIHKKQVIYAAFSPDSRRVVTASADGTARIWNSATGTPVTPALQHKGEVCYATFSPDGRWVLTASEDKTAQVWSSATGMRRGAPLRHDKQLNFASFSPDGRSVITASDDTTARVWNAETGELRGAPLVHGDEVQLASFSRDGRRVVTGSGSDAPVFFPAEDFGPAAVSEYSYSARPNSAGSKRGHVLDVRVAPVNSAQIADVHAAPVNSAQVWHTYPISTPSSSQASTLRSRAEAALASLAAEKMKFAFVAAGAPLVIVLIAIWRRRRQLQLAVMRAQQEVA